MKYMTKPSRKHYFGKNRMAIFIKNLLSPRSAVSMLAVSISFCSHAQTDTSQENTETKKPSRETEIVFVTSNKLGSASLQELPTTVKLIDSEDIKARGILDFLDFAGSVPGLMFEDSGPGDREYIIRGINSTGASAVGVYYDDIPITATNSQDGGGRNMDIKLIDMEKIEVFNGPQGTQYGANSMSGLVRYIPEKANVYEINGSIQADVSTVDNGGENVTVSGVFNVPLVKETLALRLVGWTVENDGWIDQPRSLIGPVEDVNDESTKGGRAMLRYNATDSLSVDLTYLIQNMEIGGSSEYTPDGSPYWDTDSDTIFRADGDFQNYDVGISPWDEDLKLAMLSATYELINGRFTANLSQWERDIYYVQDGTTGSLSGFVPGPSSNVQPQNREVTFAEFRYSSDFDGPLQFLLGASVKEEDNYWQIQGIALNPNTGRPHPFIPGPQNSLCIIFAPPSCVSTGNIAFNSVSNSFVSQQAVFGEILYEATDSLVFTVGARYFTSEQDAERFSRHPTLTEKFTVSSDGAKPTGKFSVAYQATSNINFYSTISQGFRVGGVNSNSGGDGDDSVPLNYDPDFLTNYELGFKTTLFDDSVTFNGALYSMIWEDIQLQSFGDDPRPFVINNGEAQVNGFEFNVTYNVNYNLTIDLAGSVLEAKLTEDQPAVIDDNIDRGNSGSSIPNTPKTQAHIGFEYFKGLNFADFTLRGDLTYRGSTDTRFDTASDYNYHLDSSQVINLRAALSFKSDLVGTFYINNLLNTVADHDAIWFNEEQLGVFGSKPRTIGFKLDKSF